MLQAAKCLRMDTMMKWGSLVERRETELRSEGFED